VNVSLNISLDGCIVPSFSTPEGARISTSSVIVLDNFLDDINRRQLLQYASLGENDDGRSFDGNKWERRTADMKGGAPTWGLRPHVLKELMSDTPPPAMMQVQARLCALYPEYHIAFLPSQAIQLNYNDDNADCSAVLCNAAVAGDSYTWHVDADPTTFPSPSPWTDAFGDYFNGEPGLPLLVSLIIYLDNEWKRDWGGETMFLDNQADDDSNSSGGGGNGVFVRPSPGRAVIMHQDVVHRVLPPSTAAGRRPRVSLVLKLVFIEKEGSGSGISISRREWGPAVAFGSAARVKAVLRSLRDGER
jgi:hypothetical protein